jgi:hypothetical protein
VRLVVENARQVGELVHDDVGPRRHDGASERLRVEHVDDRRPDAGGFKLTRDVGRARHAGDVVTGFQQQRCQPPPDGTASSGNENPHAYAFGHERPGSV